MNSAIATFPRKTPRTHIFSGGIRNAPLSDIRQRDTLNIRDHIVGQSGNSSSKKEYQTMKLCVLGGGIIGITSAYMLAEEGHSVTLIERRENVGQEASYANGGQLSYSYLAPLAGPGVISQLPPWLLRRDSPLRFYPRLNPHQWSWCLSFLLACSRHRHQKTIAELLPLSLLSKARMNQLIEHHALNFCHSQHGKLIIYRDKESFNSAIRSLDALAKLGCKQEALDASQCLAQEPALSTIHSSIAGGIFNTSDDTGNCQEFCQELRRVIHHRNNDVQILLNTTAKRLHLNGKQIVAVETDNELIQADGFIVALGIRSYQLLRPLGISLPIYPLRGYSITVPIQNPSAAPSMSITDAKNRIVFARLGDMLRVAGMVDLADYDNYTDPQRIQVLIKQARAIFPDCGDYDQLTPWSGMRPATPLSKPLIGRHFYENLWLNVGHGALGFTLACGSAQVLTDLIAGRTPTIPVEGFRLESFY